MALFKLINHIGIIYESIELREKGVRENGNRKANWVGKTNQGFIPSSSITKGIIFTLVLYYDVDWEEWSRLWKFAYKRWVGKSYIIINTGTMRSLNSIF